MLPPGYAVTYSTLARLVGTSPRAVGAWMRANKWLIVVPCHRVVASRGLGGFSRGVEFKKRLLELEAGKRGLRVIRSVEEFWKVLELEGRAVEG
ncbi:MAG: MGMT family protein [Crenarchaeota archaeon]|nr:MGMT family protein [Thermoproteota archaeon]